MRKILVIILIIICSFIFLGCGGSSSDSGQKHIRTDDEIPDAE